MEPPGLSQQRSNDDAPSFLVPGLREFVQPNPFFPGPPRPIRTPGYAGIGWVAASTGAAATLGVFLVLTNSIAGLFLVWGSGFGVCAVILLLLRRRRAEPWIHGQILPVRVLQAPRGSSWRLFWALVSLVPLVGFLFGFIGSRASISSNLARGLTMLSGRVSLITWVASDDFDRIPANSCIWLVFDQRGRGLEIESVAPKDCWKTPVPEEVAKWLVTITHTDSVSELAAGEVSQFDAEYRRAAKANTRAMKRATTYDRRV
jgi:hypothetical protein